MLDASMKPLGARSWTRIEPPETTSRLESPTSRQPSPRGAKHFNEGAWKRFAAKGSHDDVPVGLARQRIGGLIDAVQSKGLHGPRAARQLMGALEQHLLGGGGADPFGQVPKGERVNLLERSVYALSDVKPGVLGKDSLRNLDRMRHMDQVLAPSFDWDDNVLFMPTTIRIFHKEDGSFRDLSTGEFAEVGGQIGKEGTPWADFEIRPDTDEGGGSFAGFRDFDPEGFAKGMHRAVREGKLGPKALDFFAALSDPDVAQHTSIITARGHEPQTIHDGLRAMQVLFGAPKHIPPVENIFPVHNPDLKSQLSADSSAANPAGGKGVAASRLLDRLDGKPFGPQSTPVYSPQGDGEREHHHLFHFSDDDPKNYDKMKQALGAGLAAGRWKNTKVVVEFTGMRGDRPPETKVLKPDGTPRDLLPGEATEMAGIQIDRMARLFQSDRRLP